MATPPVEGNKTYVRENPPPLRDPSCGGENPPPLRDPSCGGENPPRPAATPPVEGNKTYVRENPPPLRDPSCGGENPPRPAATPPLEGNKTYARENPPPLRDPSRGGENPPRPMATPPVEGNKKIPSYGGVPERRGGSKSGAALIVVMWILLIVSLIVSTFAFEMQLESRLISAQRKRLKADQLALAGVELAKGMLAFEEDPLEGDEIIYEDPYLQEASKIAKGMPVSFTEKLGDGTITLRIDYEKGRRNIHSLEPEEWKNLFEQANIPLVDWDALIDCLKDWEDPGDNHWLNGAESDDSFYRKMGYECKNAPVDTVDELLLIKGWTKEVLYGTSPEDESEEPIIGIAQYLTTWGEDGKINPNSASREVLINVGLSEQQADDVLEARLGLDGERGTEDGGITQEDFAPLGLSTELFTLVPEYVTIISEGSVGEVVSTISSVFKLGGKEPSPLFWLEGEGKIVEDEL